jgi:demethylmenaquinone methyltransferase/2-methoxy-6-polyprenyl-1,4-benzoquinol methylase
MEEPRKAIDFFALVDRLREPAVSAAIEWLPFPKGSHGLDAGCGVGSHTGLLLDAIAPGGHLVGVDASADHLARAESNAQKGGHSARTSFQLADVGALPFEADSFDWAWSADCVGLIPGDPVEMIRGLARVVRSGGFVALLYWSSQRLLPGYPLLEARLNGTAAGLAPVKEGDAPNRHFLRSLGWLADAGLERTSAKTFIVDIHAPLTGEKKQGVEAIIEMRWDDSTSELSEEETKEFRRLTDHNSPEFILDRRDYFGFFTYSLFCGRVPG